jgi:hypothetical protein
MPERQTEQADLTSLLLGALYSKISLRGREPSQLDLKFYSKSIYIFI